MAGLDGLKSLRFLHNGLLDATGSELRKDGTIGRSKGGASGAFFELGVVTCDDEAPCDCLTRRDLHDILLNFVLLCYFLVVPSCFLCLYQITKYFPCKITPESSLLCLCCWSETVGIN